MATLLLFCLGRPGDQTPEVRHANGMRWRPLLPILSTLLAVPFLGAVTILFIPGRQKNAIRWIAASPALCRWCSRRMSSRLLGAIAGFSSKNATTWLPPPSRSPSTSASTASRADGAADRRRHLRRHARLLEDHTRTRTSSSCSSCSSPASSAPSLARPVLLLLLLRARRAADVPADRGLGLAADFPTFLRTKEYSAMKLTLMLVAASAC